MRPLRPAVRRMRIKPKDFDGEKCIKMLLDKALDPGARCDAADSLMWYPKPQTCRAMLDVIHDESEDSELREETAECLGSLWAEMKYDEKDLSSIPAPYNAALVREMNLNKKMKKKD